MQVSKSIYIVFLLNYILFLSETDAQSFSFRHFTSENGLTSSTVYSAAQGPIGNIWFATEEGVCRFDGKKFTGFTVDDGLSDNEILHIKADSKGRIWFLTLNGHLSYYFDGKFFNEGNTPWLKKTFIGVSYATLFEDSHGILYFGSIGNLIVILDQDSSVKKLNTNVTYNGYLFFEAPDYTIFIYCGYTSCLAYKNGKSTSLNLQHRRTIAKCLKSLFNDHQLYVSEDGLVKKTTDNEEVIIPINELYPPASITFFSENADRSFIIASRYGARWFPPNIYKKSEALELLPGKPILSEFVDNENNFWFCTAGDGVYMLPAYHRHFLNYTASDGLGSERINRIIIDKYDNIWLACNDGYLSEISNKKVKNFLIRPLIIGKGRVLDVGIDSRDNIFTATDVGIIGMTYEGKKQFPLQYKYIGIHSIISAKDINVNMDNSVNATLYMGIFKMENKPDSPDQIFYDLLDSTKEIRTYTHFTDRMNRLWVADIHGLNLWEGSHYICYASKNPLLEKRIHDIGETSDSVLVLSTEGYGIIFFKNGEIINHLTKTTGLSSNVCKRLFIKSDTIWISTNLGLTMVRYNKNKISNIIIYNVNNGLLSNDVRDVCDKEGKIYVATNRGLCIMENMDKQFEPAAPPPVFFTEITSENKTVSIKDGIYYFYQKNQIGINFSAITFQNPDELKFRYRLTDIHKDWIETKNNSVEFSGLSPAYYRFELQAKKFNSNWSDPITTSFILVPPFWKRLWFITIAIILILLLIYFMFWSVITQRFERRLEIARHEGMLELERIRIATDMHDDLGSDLTKIAIISEVIKESPGLTGNNQIKTELDKIIHFATDLRKKMDEIIWALNPKYDTVGNLLSFIHEYAEDFFDPTNIRCNVNIESDIEEVTISPYIKRNVFLTVKEALHNIYKHSSASMVNMELQYSGRKIIIKIKDDGKGFDETIGDSSGNGLKNMRKRIKDINGAIQIISAPGKGCLIALDCTV